MVKKICRPFSFSWKKRGSDPMAKHRSGELDGYAATSFETLVSGVLTDEKFNYIGKLV